MKGVDRHGREIDLSPLQAQVVRDILPWHQDGTRRVLVEMGRGSGKTVIMATVEWYLDGTRRLEPRSPAYTSSELRVTGEGVLKVTFCFRAVTASPGGCPPRTPRVVGWECTRADATLDGEPVFYPRSRELAKAAGITEPPRITWASEQGEPHGAWSPGRDA